MLGRMLRSLLGKQSRSAGEQEYRAWLSVEGDLTLRLDYDLSPESIVFDVGGYKGQWASDIFSKYQCRIYVFEPVADFATFIRNRFSKNGKISVFHFGLGWHTVGATIEVDADKSSLFRGGLGRAGKTEKTRIVSASDFLQERGISRIDLIKINIEGGEYDLLRHLFESGWMERILNIQVQFHEFVPESRKKRDETRRMLARTHSLTYCYDFVWENWRKRDIQSASGN